MSLIKRVCGWVNTQYFKVGAALALILCASSSFAEGESSSTYDFTAAGTAATNLGNDLATFLTSKVVPAVLVVVAAFAALLLVYRVVRWLFRAMSGR